MRLPRTAHDEQGWRIAGIAPDFEVEDVWALPVHGGADDFPQLLEVMSHLSSDESPSRLSRILFGVRWKLGEWFGWDEDVDEALRVGVEDVVGSPLEDESYGEGADGVLVWFRSFDGDLVDVLVDALTNLVNRGCLVLATPRADQDGHVEPSEIDAAPQARARSIAVSINNLGGACVRPRA